MSEEKQKYSIGQIVYILSSQGQSVIPAMVVEEQTIQTLKGISVSWKVAMGGGDKQKIVDSNRINGDIFTSLGEIKNLLTKRLTLLVDDITETARKRELAWYGTQKVNQSKKGPSDKLEPVDPESFIDDIDSDELYGQKNKISKLQSNLSHISQKEKVQELKDKLKSKIMPTREELEDDSIEPETQEVIMAGPNGEDIVTKIRMPG